MTVSYSTKYTDQWHPRGNFDHYTAIKMERRSSDDDDRSSPSIPIATVMTANENWRGKNDPAERRRIQNRLNQRAFRQRQRAGESPKQYKPRSGSSTKSDIREEEDDDDDDDEEESEDEDATSESETSQPSPPTAQSTAVSSTSQANAEAGRVCDELARIINRNFMAAVVSNAQKLGINLAALQSGTAIKTPRVGNRQVPSSLTPVELQYQVPHDPIIDSLPHARLRFNILRAIATHQLNAADFARSIRSSGALENHNGNWLRGGLVVWNEPDQPANWELSEPFVRRWFMLLQGCEDLLQATNAWRCRRGERLFPLTFNQGGSP
ncbi:uncharacterized protein LTR77_006537 [Saxophila tyrrhenica]|uniref:BZIP domain-containing protein n=1 Tax=Saxophila tyrrhenica TaxID=1690608 RepID=A0AAV9P8I3_9PEZI|nr:hypothetical protein LTR77_006537 [Saxophila tyrrhenica]